MASIYAELRGAAAYIRRVNDMPARVRAGAERAMRTVGLEMVRYIRSEQLSGQLLQRRTGNTNRATFYEVGVDRDDNAFARVGVDLKKAPGARAQELGGVITPKNGKYLTIPLDAAKTQRGVSRFRARDVIANPGAFGFVGTFTRDKIIFGKKDDRSVVPLFALREQVVLKPVGFMTKAVENKAAWIRQTVADAVRKAFREAMGG